MLKFRRYLGLRYSFFNTDVSCFFKIKLAFCFVLNIKVVYAHYKNSNTMKRIKTSDNPISSIQIILVQPPLFFIMGRI